MRPLHHQAFNYLREVYGDNPRLVDLTQTEAINLSVASSTYLQGEYVPYRTAYGQRMLAAADAYVRGEPPGEIAKKLTPPSTELQVRKYVADLALRIVSSHREYRGGEPQIPRRIAPPRPSRYLLGPGQQLPLDEQSRLFDILHEEELRRIQVQGHSDVLPSPSRIGLLCRARIAESYVNLAKARAIRIHSRKHAIDADGLEGAAYQGLMAAIENYARLPDRWAFPVFLEKALEFSFTREVSKQQSLQRHERITDHTDFIGREWQSPGREVWEIMGTPHYLQVGMLFLTPWQATVLRARYGFDGPAFTSEEIAGKYGLTKASIDSTYKKAHAVLREIIPQFQSNDLDLIAWRRDYPQRKNVFVFLAVAGERPSFDTPLPVLYEAANVKLRRATMSQEHREIIEKLYGLRGGIPETAKAVAEERGVSLSAISSLERRILQGIGIALPKSKHA